MEMKEVFCKECGGMCLRSRGTAKNAVCFTCKTKRNRAASARAWHKAKKAEEGRKAAWMAEHQHPVDNLPPIIKRAV